MDCARKLQVQDVATAQRVAVSGRTNRLLTKMIDAKAGPPGGDILSRLATLRADGELITAQAVGIASLILVAGLETDGGRAVLPDDALSAQGREPTLPDE